MPNLHTTHLHLRPLHLTDAPKIFQLRTDDIVRKYVARTKHQNEQESIEFIKYIQEGTEQNKYVFWVICYENNPNLLGTICFWNFSKDRKYAELGYELLPQYHQQGIMNEAMEAVLKYGFKTLQLHTVEAFTHKDNRGSIQLLLKNQFHLLPNRRDEKYPNNRIFVLQKAG